MKKTLLLSSLLALGGIAQAQFTQTFESGSRPIEVANCWSFRNVGLTNQASEIITGNYSSESFGAPGTSIFIKTPWLIWNNGNVTLNARLRALGNDNQGLKVYFIPFDNNQPNGEGAATGLVYQFDFATQAVPDVVTPQNLSFAVPAAVKNGQPWKMFVTFYMDNTNKLITDNWSMPATYYSDPLNGCAPSTAILDADNDGVADNDDDFPNDPNLAYLTYYPVNAAGFGSVAYEDLWPAKGDFDFNDLVVDYQLQVKSDAQSRVRFVEADLYARAVGAGINHGFGFEIDGMSPGFISNVTGQVLTDGYITLAANGLEAGQTNAVMIPWDNTESVINRVGGPFHNTDPNFGTGTADTVTVVIEFAAPYIADAYLYSTALKPFLIKGRNRMMEIHLPDRAPTDLGTFNIFGTGDDDSNPGIGRYYKTANNLPWALALPVKFDYPVEKADLLTAHLNFAAWAQSGGVMFPDWYLNLPGYRNAANIY
ncbi:LruC domain-containing protein [bacterium]|nr:LruC domain-containing protein [bacterium]